MGEGRGVFPVGSGGPTKTGEGGAARHLNQRRGGHGEM